LSFTGDVLQRIGSVFKYAKVTSRCTGNPAEGLSETRKRRAVRHQPALPKELLPEFFERLSQYDGNRTTVLGVHLLVLTLLRPGEVRKARWEEIDLDKKLWEIPAERMKMRRPHVVPLSDQAIIILTELRQYSGRLEHVFPGKHNPRQPMCENTLNQVMHRLGYKGIATSHGFRSTGSSILNEQGFNPDAIERQLAHADDDKVRAAYNRAEYLAERTSMMQWWADSLDQRAELPENVVPIRQRR
jgi:integrase